MNLPFPCPPAAVAAGTGLSILTETYVSLCFCVVLFTTNFSIWSSFSVLSFEPILDVRRAA